MPYIVTTRPSAEEQMANAAIPAVSRRAVATLDEAREAAREAVESLDYGKQAKNYHHRWQADAIPERGGTVGPLPDGTVIEVEWRAISEIMATVLAMTGDGVNAGEAVDAYNAAQA